MTRHKLYRPGPVAAPRRRPDRRGVAAFGLALLLAGPAFASPACEDRGAQAPEARCESIAFGGRSRTYRIYVPARLAAAPPLVLVLHGGGGGAAGMEALTFRGFNRRAEEAGAIIVYPEGVDRAWNDGRRDVRTRAVRQDVDDVGFLRAVVATLGARYGVDRERVFVTGISNGGMMTLRLACDAADVFRGFVAVAASLGEEAAEHCAPSTARPLALIDGDDDPIVPFAGGEVRVLGFRRGRVIGAERTFETFRRLAGCSGAQTDPPLDRIADDGTTLLIRRATGCPGDAAVTLYDIGGGGHTWPGGRAYAGRWLIGTVSRELDATEETWRFLGLAGTRRGPV